MSVPSAMSAAQSAKVSHASPSRVMPLICAAMAAGSSLSAAMAASAVMTMASYVSAE